MFAQRLSAPRSSTLRPFAARARLAAARAGAILAAAALAAALASSPVISAQTTTVASTPPMGWNSWDAYGLTVDEQQFRANVRVLADRLRPAGYRYAVVDEGWFFFNPEARPHPASLHYALDPWGRYVPVLARFPSARVAEDSTPPPPAPTARLRFDVTIQPASFAPLAAWVHSQGLLFGIHIVRGIPRASVERNLPIAGSAFRAADAADTSDACPWDPTNWGVRDTPAGQAWYDSLITQYAGWGVDLLKVDCIADHPYQAAEIRMIHRAIARVVARTGRPIVLSLSPGPAALAHAAELAANAQMWRVADDFWDLWNNPRPWPIPVLRQFATLAAWAPYAGPGHWPDADMLPFGELRPTPGEGQPRSTRLTSAEQQTVFTLWAMARSPLIVGANLTLLSPRLAALLTNPDAIAVDQTALRSAPVPFTPVPIAPASLQRESLQPDPPSPTSIAQSCSQPAASSIVAWLAELPTPALALARPPAHAPARRRAQPHAAPVSSRSFALALFNIGDQPATFDADFTAFGLAPGLYSVRDAWAASSLAADPGAASPPAAAPPIPSATSDTSATSAAPRRGLGTLTLQPHACILWMLTPAPHP